ncbi:MAG: hypothetical protein NTV05_17290 [Acidobacteria bacterium]|nr:hypothetical protein [Acidobacteriota bacterium]
MFSRARISYRALVCLVGIGLPVLDQASLVARQPKMKPEELVARHLDSIGTPEARAAVKNRVMTGTGQVIIRLPTQGVIRGPADLVSDARRIRLSMIFDGIEYPSEQFALDGNKVVVSQVRPGVRLNVPAFVYQYDVLLKEGLIGGTMTAAWCLLDVAGRQPKLEYAGMRTVEGRPLHELKYRAKKGAGEVTVALHFDPDTFRHVHSGYRLVLPGLMGATAAESPSRSDTIYHIDETFGDFKTVDAVTLPHSWKLTYSREGVGATVLCEDNLTVTDVRHNQALDAKAFEIK